MSLQDGKLRRKPLVYGKVKRPKSAYDVFDLDDVLGGGAQSRSSSKVVERTLAQQAIKGQRVIKTEKSPAAELISVRQRLTPKHKPSDSDVSMPWDFGTQDGRSQSTSAFDVPLSDQEDSPVLFVKSMQKRRRLTPVRSRSSTVKLCERSPSWSDTDENINQLSPSICARTTLQPHRSGPQQEQEHQIAKNTSFHPKPRPTTRQSNRDRCQASCTLLCPPTALVNFLLHR